MTTMTTPKTETCGSQNWGSSQPGGSRESDRYATLLLLVISHSGVFIAGARWARQDSHIRLLPTYSEAHRDRSNHFEDGEVATLAGGRPEWMLSKISGPEWSCI